MASQDEFWKWAKAEITKISKSKGISDKAAAQFLKRNLDTAAADRGRKSTTTSVPGRGISGRSPMQGRSPMTKPPTAKQERPYDSRQASSRPVPTRSGGSAQASRTGQANRLKAYGDAQAAKNSLLKRPSRPAFLGNDAYSRAQMAKNNAQYKGQSPMGRPESQRTGPASKNATYTRSLEARQRAEEDARKAERAKTVATLKANLAKKNPPRSTTKQRSAGSRGPL